jgi:hypothetical protein
MQFANINICNISRVKEISKYAVSWLVLSSNNLGKLCLLFIFSVFFKYSNNENLLL